MDYVYSYDSVGWVFHHHGKETRSSTVGIIFDEDEPFDTLLKHGDGERILQLFLSEPYSRMAKVGCRLRYVEVPPSQVELLNKCLEISASKWCSELAKEVDIFRLK